MIDTRPKLERRLVLLTQINAALNNGRRLGWGQGERISKTRMLADIGIHLVSRTAAKKRGHRVKQRQKPVVVAYFGAPIQRYTDLFILGIQTRRDQVA